MPATLGWSVQNLCRLHVNNVRNYFFLFLTLLIFLKYPVHTKNEKCQIFRLFEFNSRSLYSVDHFNILTSLNLETCASPHISLWFFIYLSFWDISCQIALRSVWVVLGLAGSGRIIVFAHCSGTYAKTSFLNFFIQQNFHLKFLVLEILDFS